MRSLICSIALSALPGCSSTVKDVSIDAESGCMLASIDGEAVWRGLPTLIDVGCGQATVVSVRRPAGLNAEARLQAHKGRAYFDWLSEPVVLGSVVATDGSAWIERLDRCGYTVTVEMPERGFALFSCRNELDAVFEAVSGVERPVKRAHFEIAGAALGKVGAGDVVIRSPRWCLLGDVQEKVAGRIDRITGCAAPGGLLRFDPAKGAQVQVRGMASRSPTRSLAFGTRARSSIWSGRARAGSCSPVFWRSSEALRSL